MGGRAPHEIRIADGQLDIGVFSKFDSKFKFLATICFEINPYGSDLAKNSVWHTNSASYVDLDRSRPRFLSFLTKTMISMSQKPIFQKTHKSTQKNLGGPEGKAPRQERKGTRIPLDSGDASRPWIHRPCHGLGGRASPHGPPW